MIAQFIAFKHVLVSVEPRAPLQSHRESVLRYLRSHQDICGIDGRLMHENEILVWILGTITLIFMVVVRAQLMRLPAAPWLFASFIAAWMGWIATNLEHLLWPQLFNWLEHAAYMINAGLLLNWCWLVSHSGMDGIHDR